MRTLRLGLLGATVVAALCLAPVAESVPTASSGWSASTSFNILGGFGSVSCVSATFCAAVGASGTAITYDGSAWKGVTGLWGGQGNLADVSCGSPSLCLALGPAPGYQVTYNGASWFGTYFFSNHAGADYTAACTSSIFCIGTGGPYGTGWGIYDNGSWIEEKNVNGLDSTIDTANLENISCASASLCVATDALERVLVYQSGVWGAPTSLASTSTSGAEAVSCAPGSTFCMAVNTNGTGHSWAYNGASWSTVPTAANGFSEGVSCATPTFCVATSGYSIMTYNGSSWGAPTRVDTANAGDLSAVSCPNASFCAAVDSQGNTFVYNAATASTPPPTTTTTTPSSSPTPSPKPAAKHGTLVASVTGNGSISGAGLSCPGRCTKTFPVRDTYTPWTLHAKSSPGYRFAGWGGVCRHPGQDNPQTCSLFVFADESPWSVENDSLDGFFKSDGAGVVKVVAKFVKSK